MSRRARRTAVKVDYARLNGDWSEDEDTDGVADGRLLYHAMMRYGGYKAQEDACQVLHPHSVNAKWLARSKLKVPLLVHKTHGVLEKLGLELPTAANSSKPMSVERLVYELGLEREVATWDVSMRREGPRWMLHQWGQYWTVRRCISVKANKGKPPKTKRGKKVPSEDDEAESSRVNLSSKRQAHDGDRDTWHQEHEAREHRGIVGSVQSVGSGVLKKGISNDARRKILEIIALPLAGTSIGRSIRPPACVIACDLIARVCPKNWSHQHELGLEAGLFANIAVAGSYVDFKFSPGGAALWMHALSGKKALCCIPPTTWNLAAYLSWLNTERHEASFFAALAEEAALIEMHAGETVFIPAGWLVAQATVDDSFVIGSSFFHAGGIGGVLRVIEAQDCLGMPRLQAEEELLWYTALFVSREICRYIGKARHETCLADVRATRAQKVEEDVAKENELASAHGLAEGGSGDDIWSTGVQVQSRKKRPRSPSGSRDGGMRQQRVGGSRRVIGVQDDNSVSSDDVERMVVRGEETADAKEMPTSKKVRLKLPQCVEPTKGDANGIWPERIATGVVPPHDFCSPAESGQAVGNASKHAGLVVKLGDKVPTSKNKAPSLMVKLGDKGKGKHTSGAGTTKSKLRTADPGAGAPAPLTVKLGAKASAVPKVPHLTFKVGNSKGEDKAVALSSNPKLKDGNESTSKPMGPSLKVKLGANSMKGRHSMDKDAGDSLQEKGAQSATAALSTLLARKKTTVKLPQKFPSVGHTQPQSKAELRHSLDNSGAGSSPKLETSEQEGLAHFHQAAAMARPSVSGRGHEEGQTGTALLDVEKQCTTVAASERVMKGCEFSEEAQLAGAYSSGCKVRGPSSGAQPPIASFGVSEMAAPTDAYAARSDAPLQDRPASSLSYGVGMNSRVDAAPLEAAGAKTNLCKEGCQQSRDGHFPGLGRSSDVDTKECLGGGHPQLSALGQATPLLEPTEACSVGTEAWNRDDRGRAEVNGVDHHSKAGHIPLIELSTEPKSLVAAAPAGTDSRCSDGVSPSSARACAVQQEEVTLSTPIKARATGDEVRKRQTEVGGDENEAKDDAASSERSPQAGATPAHTVNVENQCVTPGVASTGWTVHDEGRVGNEKVGAVAASVGVFKNATNESEDVLESALAAGRIECLGEDGLIDQATLHETPCVASTGLVGHAEGVDGEEEGSMGDAVDGIKCETAPCEAVAHTAFVGSLKGRGKDSAIDRSIPRDTPGLAFTTLPEHVEGEKREEKASTVGAVDGVKTDTADCAAAAQTTFSSPIKGRREDSAFDQVTPPEMPGVVSSGWAGNSKDGVSEEKASMADAVGWVKTETADCKELLQMTSAGPIVCRGDGNVINQAMTYNTPDMTSTGCAVDAEGVGTREKKSNTGAVDGVKSKAADCEAVAQATFASSVKDRGEDSAGKQCKPHEAPDIASTGWAVNAKDEDGKEATVEASPLDVAEAKGSIAHMKEPASVLSCGGAGACDVEDQVDNGGQQHLPVDFAEVDEVEKLRRDEPGLGKTEGVCGAVNEDAVPGSTLNRRRSSGTNRLAGLLRSPDRGAPRSGLAASKGRTVGAFQPQTAPEGEVLIPLGRHRTVSRVPSRPLMAAAMQAAQQQVGEVGSGSGLTRRGSREGVAGDRVTPEKGLAGVRQHCPLHNREELRQERDGADVKRSEAIDGPPEQRPRVPTQPEKPQIKPMGGPSPEKLHNNNPYTATPSAPVRPLKVRTTVAEQQSTKRESLAKAEAVDAEESVCVRTVDGDMIGPWSRDDLLALLATLRMSVQTAPEGVPPEITRPEELLDELEAGLLGVGVDLQADTPARELDTLSRSITLDLQAASLPSSLPKWQIYDDAEAVEEAGDNSPQAIVGSPRDFDVDGTFGAGLQFYQHESGPTQTAAGPKRDGKKPVGTVHGAKPASGGGPPKKSAPKASVKDRLKKKLKIK